MVDKSCNVEKIDIVKMARAKGKIVKYADFCKTKLAKETTLTEDEVAYYTSLEREKK